MSVRSLRLLAVASIATTLLTAGAAPDAVRSDAKRSPPWISIETPVNPYDPSTRGALLVVHTFHHGVEVGLPVTGTAEGIVNGVRRSVPLQLTPISRPGAYVVRNQWGSSGVWTLDIVATPEENAVVQALVEVGADGRVTGVEVPTRFEARSGSTPLPRRIGMREIDQALRARARG